MKVKFYHEKFHADKELDPSQLLALYNANEIEILVDNSPYCDTSKRVNVVKTTYQVNNLIEYPVLHVYLEDK